jgi:hypothetical protein
VQRVALEIVPRINNVLRGGVRVFVKWDWGTCYNVRIE